MEGNQTPSFLSLSHFCELLDTVVSSHQLATLMDGVLTCVEQYTRPKGLILYLRDERLGAPQFFHRGLSDEAATIHKQPCQEYLSRGDPGRFVGEPVQSQFTRYYVIQAGQKRLGILGQVGGEQVPDDAFLEKLLGLFGKALDRLADETHAARQLAHLNTYLTISSMLCQSQGLHELLEMALYCCMEIVSAETASVMLLEDDKQFFRFYHVEGTVKEVLEAAKFPADQGVAGAVLRTQQAEIINDAPMDPRFYGQIDKKSGFQTRNMIAIPLIAGEEKIGVLEVLNKIDGTDFTTEEQLLLCSIAEEIAFAIRNAKVFEYVANSYCKQRQGLGTCRGCQRPLGSWTPCVRYREGDFLSSKEEVVAA